MMKIFAVCSVRDVLHAPVRQAPAAVAVVQSRCPCTNYTDMPPYHPMPTCRTKRCVRAFVGAIPQVYGHWSRRDLIDIVSPSADRRAANGSAGPSLFQKL